MVKYSWLGPYEEIREKPDKFAKYCTLKSKANSKIVKETGKPDNVALWNFIGNIRDNIIFVGDIKSPSMSYQNIRFMNLFQQNLQNLWKIFEPKFNEFIQIIPLMNAKRAGLYDRDCLREQFPSSSSGNAPGYKNGSFDKRQTGGWKWFSLILDEENWDNKWNLEKISDILTIKEQTVEVTAPKYYKPYIYSKGKWLENRKGEAYYGKPSNCNVIPRRYCIPVIVSTKPGDESFQRYKKFVNIILKKLETQWTLNVWNIISFDYKLTENNVKLVIKPVIYIDIGWIEPNPMGEKNWGKAGENLHRHFKEVFSVRVGLLHKYRLNLPLYIKTKLNPIWDGTPEGILGILFEPYTKLIDLVIHNLRLLISS